ncbi:hypothetical protein AN478_09770 [Thiohalorhabdus denitrificans]|uniref:Uncharacterized conserved protein YbgA, DUF1722 family n=1 Tax=Thiohalorhabdus denitrificans TaxID=381306 RepID=A0A0P9ELJ8_9GAMM|nr:DUF1722 domain-containing protein [Thiohalorhabdus denitrificans]KPV39450.1 hypothetical protein AN478_09770 [Thiohalorhabdus denitrificans]SCY02562.1 Uncharacterized conserved protein YbgA, DUF1722 family [Thiohalorhabdus denitrificans]
MRTDTVRIGVNQMVQSGESVANGRQPMGRERVSPIFPEGVELIPLAEKTEREGPRYPGLKGVARASGRWASGGEPRARVRREYQRRERAIRRWRELFERADPVSALKAFHEEQGPVVMARAPREHARLSTLVTAAEAGTYPAEQIARSYLEAYLGALREPVTKEGLGAVLGTAWDELSPHVSQAERRQLGQVIWAFLRGRIPLDSVLHRTEELLIRNGLADSAGRLRSQLDERDGVYSDYDNQTSKGVDSEL